MAKCLRTPNHQALYVVLLQTVAPKLQAHIYVNGYICMLEHEDELFQTCSSNAMCTKQAPGRHNVNSDVLHKSPGSLNEHLLG